MIRILHLPLELHLWHSTLTSKFQCKGCTQTYSFQEHKIWGEYLISFFISHYGHNRGGLCVQHWNSKGNKTFWKETTWKKCTKHMVLMNRKYKEKIWFPFFICHYAYDRGGIFVKQRRSRTRPRQRHTPISLVIVVTYEDVLEEDFRLGIPSTENSYLQTRNRKQQPMNKNATTTMIPTSEWGTT